MRNADIPIWIRVGTLVFLCGVVYATIRVTVFSMADEVKATSTRVMALEIDNAGVQEQIPEIKDDIKEIKDNMKEQRTEFRTAMSEQKKDMNRGLDRIVNEIRNNR